MDGREERRCLEVNNIKQNEKEVASVRGSTRLGGLNCI